MKMRPSTTRWCWRKRFVGGGEYTVGILGETALPVIRIVPANEFYDYEAKYLRDDTALPVPLRPGRRDWRRRYAAEALRHSAWWAGAVGGGWIF